MTSKKDFTQLVLTNFVYVRLKGLIWTCNGLIKGNNLDIDAATELGRIYSESQPGKPLVVDCKGVINVTDRSWDGLFESISTLKREIVFINSIQLDEKINSRYTEYCSTQTLTKTQEPSAISIFSGTQKLRVDADIVHDVNALILENIKDNVADCFEENPGGEYKYLYSTPIKATGEFNAANLIESPEKFYWLSLRICDMVDEIVKQYKIGSKFYPLCLLAVSLRSCPLAAAVSLLSGIPLETIDHIGPITKVWDVNKGFYQQKHHEYIYIGDFTIGGTEIKLSQTYANLRQCKLDHAIVIGSLLPGSVYSGISLHNLLVLADRTPKAKYTLF